MEEGSQATADSQMIGSVLNERSQRDLLVPIVRVQFKDAF